MIPDAKKKWEEEMRFAEWAFGKDVWQEFLTMDKDVIDLMHAWNDRHSDKHKIEEDDPIQTSLQIITEIWKKNEKK